MRHNEGYRQLSPEIQTAEITRAKAHLDVADKADITLSHKDLFFTLGYKSSLSIRKRRKKTKTIKAMHQDALQKREEHDLNEKVKKWIDKSMLLPELSHKNVGNTMLQTPILKRSTEMDKPNSYALDSLLHVDTQVSESIDSNSARKLKQREQFWNNYDITNGPELQDFLTDNFTRKEIAFEGKLPIEMQWLREIHPDDYAFLAEQAKNDHAVTLTLCKQTPKKILKSIRDIATDSQHKFVTTWLPDLVMEGLDPVILQSDRVTLEKEFDKQKKAAEKIKTKDLFKGQLIETVATDAYAEKSDFEAAIGRIKDFLPLFMTVEVNNTDGTLDPQAEKRIQEINQKLTEGLGKRYALKKLLFDDAENVSEAAQKILKVTTATGITATLLENKLHLPGIAKFVAGSTDDIAGETAEISSLRKVGVSWKDLRERLNTLIPTAAIAFGLAYTVELTRKVNENLAGAQFMTSSVLLSAVTSVLSANYFGKDYKQLAQDGKLREYYPIVPQEENERIKQRIQKHDSNTPDTIWEGIKVSLKDDPNIAEKETTFRRFAQGKKPEVIFERMKEPSTITTKKKGIKEAMGINPARFGIALGSFTAPLVGLATGPFILPIPFVYAIAGAYEGLAGIGSILVHKKAFPHLWKHEVKKVIKTATSAFSLKEKLLR